MRAFIISIGKGNLKQRKNKKKSVSHQNFWRFAILSSITYITVRFFSELIEHNVWRYLSCTAVGDLASVMAASLNDLLAFLSPVAAITFALASLEASAYNTNN